MPQPKQEGGELLSSACWVIETRLLQIEFFNDVIEDALPHTWIAVDVAVLPT